ncbi:hypothetical protein PR048_001833 [Dryococelus australis]|uniref:Uncharacterized protein n=1 Tax=Dryococelus australis TaxID=614101 RepID=A0ABQ9IIM5_9NEOP|nr:hypothetical protein PR048_001833 [Dryococelus australis]
MVGDGRRNVLDRVSGTWHGEGDLSPQTAGPALGPCLRAISGNLADCLAPDPPQCPHATPLTSPAPARMFGGGGGFCGSRSPPDHPSTLLVCTGQWEPAPLRAPGGGEMRQRPTRPKQYHLTQRPERNSTNHG